MVSIPADDVVRRRITSMDQAAAVLNTHVSTDDAVCGGCLRMWGRWVPANGCTQVAWARSIIETHGIADDAWDVRTPSRYTTVLAR